MTVVGTRPEIIRLSRTLALLDETVDHVLVHTGQNQDYELNEIFFQELGIRKPNYFLETDNTSLGSQVSGILLKTETIIRKEKPDALLVLGDTNSCLSAYIAKRMHIPVFHMEAGNRCFDLNVPEETNRRIIDHISDFNLVYSEHARRHLIAEGLPHRRIYLTGSPMKEVLDYFASHIHASTILSQLKLEPNHYFIVSFHREENVDNEENLEFIVTILNELAKKYHYPVIVSTHPRTRKRLEENRKLHSSKAIRFMKPFGFFDYNKLQMNAACAISDSGTICEESAILGFPAVSLRNSMERPEAQDTGSIILTGLDKDIVLDSVAYCTEERTSGRSLDIPAAYKISNTSRRVVKLILGNTKLSNKWDGTKRSIR
ncbi:MAG: UDP-N-acetylglucosamine 2-epimerase (non-hydrolyzing) [Bacteroidetes bacterium]|nr:UDP-N-acetylglucosamine 2-epimerase (non-hydrolyzing) [Bacteroidota bacterium]